MGSLARLLLPLVLPTVAGSTAAQTTFLVTNTDDGGPGSLRQAIADANANPGADRIDFAIPGPGPHTIQPLSELTPVLEAVVIDGYSQAGAVPNTNSAGSGLGTNAALAVVLDGSLFSASDGLQINGSGVTVRGLAIHGFGAGIRILSGADDGRVEGCFLGTDRTGTVAMPNDYSGLIVGGRNCTVGGTDPAARNVISGNHGRGMTVSADGARILGNLIGTDAAGTVVLTNTYWGIELTGLIQDVQIGGVDPGLRNLLAGTNYPAIRVGLATGTRIRGNWIGTDATGTYALANAGGIDVHSGHDTVIGGPEPGAANVVSGSFLVGIDIPASSSGTVVWNNHVGVDATGSAALGNAVGIRAEAPARIGGPGQGNLISGNGTAILIRGTSGVQVLENLVGCDATGTAPVPNGVGVEIRAGDDNRIVRNRILFNASDGVRVVSAQRNRITRNSIAESGHLGIDLGSETDGPSGVTPNDPGDLDVGPNGLQNFPLLDFAFEQGGSVVVGGLLSSRPSSVYVIELFGSSACGVSEHGEGETYLASRTVATDGRGLAFFTLVVPGPVGRVVTATATDASGNTSEFSLCRPVLPLRPR